MSELQRIELFAGFLGWDNIQCCKHRLPRDGNEVITWYESGSPPDMFLQINRAPHFAAAVYAMRYRIFTGWHPFELSDDRLRLEGEAERLADWLRRDGFTSLEARREFRRKHPECANITWRKIRHGQ